MFRPEDIKNLQLIYHLMRERKYTMEGAKDFLKKSKKADEKFVMIESLKKLKAFLQELKAIALIPKQIRIFFMFFFISLNLKY